MSPPIRVRAKDDSSFVIDVDVQSGQATIVVPLDDTSSSKRCEHVEHSYS